jgi:hypothetical protein
MVVAEISAFSGKNSRERAFFRTNPTGAANADAENGFRDIGFR